MSADDRQSPPPPTSLARPDRATLVKARDARERVIARLSEAFSQDVLEVEEFERRVTVAQVSESPEEIEALLADLDAAAGGVARPVPATAPVRAPAPAPAPLPASLVPPDFAEGNTLVAIMSGLDRRGSWTVPSRLRIIAFMGGARLDLREARFPPGPIDIEVFAMMGGVEIIVPPELAVQVHGMAIMGGFQEINRAPAHPDPDAALLRIHGFAMMGGVDVHMRLQGESDRDARRRHRDELRDEMRAQRRLARQERRR